MFLMLPKKKKNECMRVVPVFVFIFNKSLVVMPVEIDEWCNAMSSLCHFEFNLRNPDKQTNFEIT